jgi:hypothetical protein
VPKHAFLLQLATPSRAIPSPVEDEEPDALLYAVRHEAQPVRDWEPLALVRSVFGAHSLLSALDEEYSAV